MTNNKKTTKTPYVLVLYYSEQGNTEAVAHQIANGIDQQNGIEAKLRTVESLNKTIHVKKTQAPVVTQEELANCIGLAMGSPAHFGNMAAALSAFWGSTTPLWLQGALIDKPATVFTSSNSLHGGQESVPLSMMHPLLHHGMLILGIPYNVASLNETTAGGSPYAASHVENHVDNKHNTLTHEEKKIAQSLGQRLAMTALKQLGSEHE